MAFEGSSKVLMTVRETASTKKEGSGWGQWVIAYYDKDGKPFSAKLVCGEYYTTPEGEKRYKAKGMALKDFETLRPKWKEVEAIMKNPPQLQTASPAAEGEPEHDQDEAAPF